MTNLNICPACGEGSLHPENVRISFNYKDNAYPLDTEYSVCDCCGSEIINDAQAKRNKRKVIALQKNCDGLLTGKQVYAIRRQLGLTQAEAAKIFGGGPSAFSKYEADDVTQSLVMDKMLRLASSSPEVLDKLCEMAGIRKKFKVTWTTADSEPVEFMLLDSTVVDVQVKRRDVCSHH